MDVVRFLSFYTQALLPHSELFEVCLVSTEGNLKAKSYSSLNERGQESIQGFGLLEWWEGVVSQFSLGWSLSQSLIKSPELCCSSCSPSASKCTQHTTIQTSPLVASYKIIHFYFNPITSSRSLRPEITVTTDWGLKTKFRPFPRCFRFGADTRLLRVPIYT